MQDKDYIEKIIQNNIDALNDNDPMEGHFARFEKKLNARNKKKKITLKFVLKIAAAFVFALLATNQAFIYFAPNGHGLFQQNNTSEITLSSLSPEFQEVEFYYTNSIDNGIGQWNQMKSDGLISEEEQALMSEELSEFETLYKTLQEDLQSNPNDERVINAMLEYYQAKLGIINMIVDKLEDVQQKQNSNIKSTSTKI